jgi:predicted DNA-binding transcriptional regulator AlpA
VALVGQETPVAHDERPVTARQRPGMPEGPDRLLDVREAAALLADPAALPGVPRGSIPGLLAVVEYLKASLWSRLVAAADSTPAGELSDDRDGLLTATEAAALLGMSRHWLYKNAARLPFTRRVGPRTVRFSAVGLRQYIASGRR